MNEVADKSGDVFSKRQGEVLDAALKLLAAGEDRLSMTAIARTASCSKETLYNWFGDSDGVLSAIVRRQASKVRMPEVAGETLDSEQLRARLTKFAGDLLAVLAGDMSVALNRLAVSHAGSAKSELGRIVLENGRFAMGHRLKPLIEAGQAAGILTIEQDSETLFRTFFGLVVRDVQIRLLLGDTLTMSAASIADDAQVATAQFIQLFSPQIQPSSTQNRVV